MDYAVIIQATGLGEGLVTGGACEGLNSCVCPLVTLQCSRHSESLATLGAEMGFLSLVESHVSHQVT